MKLTAPFSLVPGYECVELCFYSPIRVFDVECKQMRNFIFTSCIDGSETMKDCQNWTEELFFAECESEV